MCLEVDEPPVDHEHDNSVKPDWHGEKAKQKRQAAARAVNIRSFAFGLLAALALVMIGVFALSRIQNGAAPGNQFSGWNFVTAQFAVIATETFAATPTVTETMSLSGQTAMAEQIMGQTRTAADRATTIAIAQTQASRPTPTITPVPTIPEAEALSTAPDQLVEYTFTVSDPAQPDVLPSLHRLQKLAIEPLATYHFTGARFGPNGSLYVGHTRLSDVIACDTNEAYWVINPKTGQLIGHIDYPALVSPKQIAFDSQANAYILGIDCKQRVHAIFKFDPHGQWIDTFPIVGGDDLAITTNDRILVALSGFANDSVAQAHLIELTSNPTTGKLVQAAPLQIGDAIGGHYRSLLIFTPDGLGLTRGITDYLFMVWAGGDVPDQLQSFGAIAQVPLANVNAGFLQNGSIHNALGNLQVDNLANVGATIVGLSLDRRNAVVFTDPTGGAFSFPIPGLRVTTFAVDPVSGHWFMGGQPENTNTPTAP